MVAQQLHTSLKQIDAQIQSAYQESLNSACGHSDAELRSQASRNSSYYNFENNIEKIRRLNKSIQERRSRRSQSNEIAVQEVLVPVTRV